MEWLGKHRNKLLLAGGYAIIAVLLDLSSGAFVLQTGLAICYPPAGLYLAAIILFGWKALPLAFLNPVFSVLVTLQSPDIHPIAVFGIGAASMVSPAIVLVLLRKISPQEIHFHTIRDVVSFSVVTLFAVTVESLVAASVYTLTGLGAQAAFGTIATGWWISNIIPYFTLTPVILLWYQRWPDRWAEPGHRMVIQAVLIVVCIPLAVLIALFTNNGESVSRLYVAFLPILWAALVGGTTGAAWASLFMTTTVLVLSPALLFEPGTVVEAQFFLLVATLTGLVTGAIVTERRQAEAALRESEKKYRGIVDNASEGIFQSTLDGHYINVNPAMARIYGYESPQEMIQKVTDIPTQIYVNPEARKELQRRLTEENNLTGFESQYYRKDGTTFWATINIHAVLDAEGNFLFYEGTAEDITIHKATTEKLRERQHFIETVLDAEPGTVYIFDLQENRNVFINQNWLVNYGYGIEETQSAENFLAEIIHPEDLPRVIEHHNSIRSTKDDKSAIEVEYRIRKKDGEWRWVLSRDTPFTWNAAGQVTQILGILHDITEKIKIQEEVQKLNEELKQRVRELEDSNAEMSQFTYTVSHDLKSPLVTINGYLGYIEQDAASGNMERLKKDTQRIQEATNKMHALLAELLELSRIGRIMNEPKNIPFADLVQDAMDIVHEQLQSRRVTVRTQPNLPIVHGDRQRLTEVLQNLLDNAVKYMGAQNDPLIEIGQRGEDDGRPVFFIKDNGIGIAPEYHERVFGLFNKLDAKSEGTGIGLTLVKRIIEFHGGRVWVKSGAGKGSTFYFTLPIR